MVEQRRSSSAAVHAPRNLNVKKRLSAAVKPQPGDLLSHTQMLLSCTITVIHKTTRWLSSNSSGGKTKKSEQKEIYEK